jgi:hypothetical protein
MSAILPWRNLLSFGAKFSLALLILAPLWWLCLPGYGWLLVQGCGGAARSLLGVPIVAGHVRVDGILNTESLLVFYVGARELTMKFALLVTNLPPFLALIIATPALKRMRRLALATTGAAILIAGHALYVVVALRFGAFLAANSEVATAISQFFLTLPFGLWVAMAYWKKDEPER